MITRDEFHARMDDLKDHTDQRINDLKDHIGHRFEDHDRRLEKLEGEPSGGTIGKKFWGTAIGAALYGVIDYTWRKWSGQ